MGLYCRSGVAGNVYTPVKEGSKYVIYQNGTRLEGTYTESEAKSTANTLNSSQSSTAPAPAPGSLREQSDNTRSNRQAGYNDDGSMKESEKNPRDDKNNPQNSNTNANCKASADFGVNNCGMIDGMSAAAKGTATLSTALATAMAGSIGQNAQQNSGNTQQMLEDASANTKKMAMVAIGGGVLTTAVGGGAVVVGMGAEGEAKKIDQGTNGAKGHAGVVLEKAVAEQKYSGAAYAKRMQYELGDQAQNDAKGKDIQARGQEAINEQKEAASKAKGAGAQAITQGIGSIAAGLMALQSAKNLQQAADELKDAQNQANPIFTPDPGSATIPEASPGVPVAPPAAPPSADSMAPTQSAVLGQNGTTDAATQDTPQTAKNDGGGGDLGAPFNPNGGGNPMPGGEPGKLGGPGGTGGAAGGGSGGLFPASATAPAQDTSGADSSPRLADNREKADYSSGGAYGNVSGGNGAEKGPDLSSLLAMLKPGEEKKDDKQGNSSLEFGDRSPAGEPVSLLDRRVDIFKRIHDTYQDKHRQGMIKGAGSGS